MLYVAYIRPTILVWQNYFSGRKAAARARDRLFFGHYRPVTSTELSRNLSLHTERILGIKLSVGVWRHVATWFLNYHSVKFHEHRPVLTRSALAYQSGHGDGMHTLYSGDIRLPSGIDFHKFFETMRVSGIWHKLIGFSHAASLSLLDAMDRMPCLAENAPLEVSIGSENRSTLPCTSDIAEEVKKYFRMFCKPFPNLMPMIWLVYSTEWV